LVYPAWPVLKKLAKSWALRGASTVSIVELLLNDWTGGISSGVAWLVFLLMEIRLPLSPETED
jgi:hypothetical protein